MMLPADLPTPCVCPRQICGRGVFSAGPRLRGGPAPVWIRPPLGPAGLHPPAHWTVVAWKRLRRVRRALFLLPSWRHVDPPHDPGTPTSLLPRGMSCCTEWPLRWNPTIQRPPQFPITAKRLHLWVQPWALEVWPPGFSKWQIWLLGRRDPSALWSGFGSPRASPRAALSL